MEQQLMQGSIMSKPFSNPLLPADLANVPANSGAHTISQAKWQQVRESPPLDADRR